MPWHGPLYIGVWLSVWQLGGVVRVRLGVGVGSLPRAATWEVHCLLAYIRAKHIEFSPSYDSFLYVWFFDHIGVFVVDFVFVFFDIGIHLLRPPDRGDFVRSTVYYGWIGLWCVAG